MPELNRILYVEDDDDIRQVAQLALEEVGGYEVSLCESGQQALVDITVVVDIPESLQLSRTLARDGVSEQQVHAILGAQLPRSERLARADEVIENHRDQAYMREQVAVLDAKWRQAASTTDT